MRRCNWLASPTSPGIAAPIPSRKATYFTTSGGFHQGIYFKACGQPFFVQRIKGCDSIGEQASVCRAKGRVGGDGLEPFHQVAGHSIHLCLGVRSQFVDAPQTLRSESHLSTMLCSELVSIATPFQGQAGQRAASGHAGGDDFGWGEPNFGGLAINQNRAAPGEQGDGAIVARNLIDGDNR